VASLKGWWDEWERGGATSLIEPPRRYRIILLDVIRAGLVSFLPFGVYLLGRRYSVIDVEPTMNGYLEGALLLWAFLSLTFAIDPAMKEKLASVKEIVGVFRPGKEKG
jgi:hypothetical protein